MVEHRQHPARSRDAARLGADGRRLQDAAAQPGQPPTKVAQPGSFRRRRISATPGSSTTRRSSTAGKGNKTHLKVVGEQPEWGPNWDEDQGAGEYPNSYYFYLPRICNHCTHPACLEACPAQGDREARGGRDRRDQRGPLPRLPLLHGGVSRTRRSTSTTSAKVSQKCIFCFPRIEQGVANACARQCPGRVRFVGYRDDPEAPIWKLVDKWKVAIPLHPEYGTESERLLRAADRAAALRRER